MFPQSEARPGQYVSDSVGLHAFGLPDVQIATETEPDETVSVALYRLVERFFCKGCEEQDGSEIDLADGGRWRVTRCRAVFPPDREVIELAPVKTAAHDRNVRRTFRVSPGGMLARRLSRSNASSRSLAG